MLLWVSFNAVYAGELRARVGDERTQFGSFFRSAVACDGRQRLHEVLYMGFAGDIWTLMNSPHVFEPYWHHVRGRHGHDQWQRQMLNERTKMQIAMNRAADEAQYVDGLQLALEILFDRIYMLRNQIVHGGATWAGKVNRVQVEAGARILAELVPILIGIMMERPDHEWGEPLYPPQDVPETPG